MSEKYELVKSYYDRGLWNADRVRNAVSKGWITQEECDAILATPRGGLNAAEI